MLELKDGSLGRLERLASGGQAHIYRAPDVTLSGEQGPFVYKRYRDSVVEGRRPAVRTALSALIRVRTSATDADRNMIDRRSTWPLAVVVDEHGGATGCIMREIPRPYFCTLSLSTGKTLESPWEWSLHLQPAAEVAARGLPPLTEARTMYLLARVLQFSAMLHRLDVVVGDFSSANILVTINQTDDRGCSPMFVDVDSYRRGSAVAAIQQPHTPGWETPENVHHRRLEVSLRQSGADANQIARARARRRIQDRPSDVYKAGLLIIRTLDGGPDAGFLRTSAVAEQRLRQLRGRRNAETVLAALRAQPASRPTMDEVSAAFTGA